jgi:nitroreductase
MGPITFFRHLKQIIQSRPQVPESVADNPLLKIILNRRSIRRFDSREIPEEAFAAILEAGRVAPCSVNLQTWSFFVFTAREWADHFGDPLPFKGSRGVIVCGDIHRLKSKLTSFPDSPIFEYSLGVMNASLAAMNMNIAAEALGISSIMLSETGKTGLFNADYLKEKLRLPDGVFPIMTLVFGYAKSGYPPMPPKLPAEYMFFKDTYQETPPEALQDWFDKMTAGYKANFPLKTFKGQLEFYRGHFEDAEKILKEMIFHYPEDPSEDPRP